MHLFSDQVISYGHVAWGGLEKKFDLPVIKKRRLPKSVFSDDANNKLASKLPCVRRLCFDPARFSVDAELFAVFGVQ